MGQSYLTIDKAEVKRILSQVGVQEYLSNSVNHSMIYKMKNGKVMLWPAGGQFALLFENVEEYDSVTAPALRIERTCFTGGKMAIKRLGSSEHRHLLQTIIIEPIAIAFRKCRIEVL